MMMFGSSYFFLFSRVVKVVVKGKNVGYGATCECMVQSAVVMLKQTNRLPSTGGVWTPGYAFADTDLVDRLNARKVTFDTTVPTVQSV